MTSLLSHIRYSLIVDQTSRSDWLLAARMAGLICAAFGIAGAFGSAAWGG